LPDPKFSLFFVSWVKFTDTLPIHGQPVIRRLRSPGLARRQDEPIIILRAMLVCAETAKMHLKPLNLKIRHDTRKGRFDIPKPNPCNKAASGMEPAFTWLWKHQRFQQQPT
jgi:hypothetical protein